MGIQHTGGREVIEPTRANPTRDSRGQPVRDHGFGVGTGGEGAQEVGETSGITPATSLLRHSSEGWASGGPKAFTEGLLSTNIFSVLMCVLR